MKRSIATLVITVGVLSSPVSAAELSLPKPRQHWIEVGTANFRFFSNAGRHATRRVAVDLEELRAVLAQLTNYDLKSPIPTFIYVFKGERSFLPYKILYQGRPATLSGYFIAGDEANYIAINADASNASAIIYHEYVHYVANNNLWYLPAWFSEGLAEFYESFEVSGDTVYIGLPILRHLLVLRGTTPIPIDQLLAVDHTSELYNEADRKGVFYAESWALVHYLLLGDEDRRRQLGRYLDLVRNGTPGNEAFAAAFTADYRTLAAELRGHLRSLRFPWIETKAEIDLDKNLEMRKMPYAEVLYRLGNLLASQQPERPERRAYFAASIEAEPEYGPSLSSLAVEAERVADWDAAHALHARAAAASPDDPLVLYRFGRFLSRRGDNHVRAAAVLTRSTELDPSFQPAWAALAKVYVDAGATSDEAVEAARIAHALRPSDIMAARDLVRLYLHLDRRQEAVSLIEDALRSNRRLQAQAWMLVIQQDLVRARELLQANQPTQAMQRMDLAEQIVDRSMNPGVTRQNIKSTRRSIIEYQAVALFNRAQELFSAGDRDAARELLVKAVALIDDGPVASSSRRLLDIIDHPERLTEAPVSTFSPSPTASEIEHLNHLIATRDFDTALEFLEGMRGRVGQLGRAWLDERISEIRRTVDYNRFVDEYNRAVDFYNRKQFGEAVRVLEALLATLPEGQESESARALLDDALKGLQ